MDIMAGEQEITNYIQQVPNASNISKSRMSFVSGAATDLSPFFSSILSRLCFTNNTFYWCLKRSQVINKESLVSLLVQKGKPSSCC